MDGTGSDVITYRPTLPQGTRGPLTLSAALYYQAIPPRYLQDRFTTAHGDNTKRLHYLASHLNLEGTNIENWKLLTGSDSAQVSR